VGARGIRFAPRIPLATLLGAACAASAAAQAQSPTPDVAACVYGSNIDHTRILDDRDILFFMRDHSIYQNTFVPVDKEVVDDLITASESPREGKNGDRRNAIKVEPVELPPPEPPVSTSAPSSPAKEPASGAEPAPTAPDH
jgi:hypothetical protein